MKVFKKIKLFLMVFCLIILCMGCANKKEDKGLETSTSTGKIKDEIRIENTCESLTSEKADVIAKEIREEMLNTWEEINRLENFEMIFSDEKQEEGETVIDITVKADWTTYRRPEESPIIIGMNEVVEELKTEEEKKTANVIISGYLAEIKSEYNVTERLPTYLKVKYKNKNDLDYEVFYPYLKDKITTLYPMKEYFAQNCKENKETRKQLGRETLLEALKN